MVVTPFGKALKLTGMAEAAIEAIEKVTVKEGVYITCESVGAAVACAGSKSDGLKKIVTFLQSKKPTLIKDEKEENELMLAIMIANTALDNKAAEQAEELGLGAKKTDSEGMVVIDSKQVQALRKAEQGAAGCQLPVRMTASDNHVKQRMRGLQQTPRVLKNCDLGKLTYEQAARKSAERPTELSKLAGPTETDNVENVGGGAIGSLHRIVLDAAALSIASATVVPAAKGEVDGPMGYVVKLNGNRVRIAGGRRIVLSVLDYVFKYGRNKSGADLEYAWGRTLVEAAEILHEGVAEVGPAIEIGLEKAVADWRDGGQDARKFLQEVNGGNLSGTKRGRERDVCGQYNSVAGCPRGEACTYEHVCSKKGKNGGICGSKSHTSKGHGQPTRGTPTKGPAVAEVTEPASGVSGARAAEAKAKNDRQARLDAIQQARVTYRD